MSSNKRSFVKTYKSKTRSYAKRPSSNAKLAAARMVANSSTRGFLGIENKFIDTSSAIAIASSADGSGGEVDPAAPLSSLSVMAEGDGPSSRDGRQIQLTNVFVNGQVTGSAVGAATVADGYIYIALVQDRQTNGQQLRSEDVFVNPGAASFTSPYPLRNLAYTKRFRVLDHVRVGLDSELYTSGAVVGSVGGHSSFQLSHRFKTPLECNFSAAGADIANCVDNSLHVIAYCDDTTLTPTINYNARVRFQG